MDFLINSLTALIGMFLCYRLSLTFIGAPKKFKEVLVPTLIFAILTFISKFVLETSPTIHTMLLLIVNSFLLWVFNDDIGLAISLIGSLFTYIAITLGGELITCPILLKLGFHLPMESRGIDWDMSNLADFILIILLIGTIRISKFSIKKFISVINGT